MSKFKTIALYSSKDDHKVSIIGSQLVEIFSNMGIRVLIAKSSTAIDSRIKRTYSERYIVEKADLLISIGGDGTLLSAARIFGARGLPLMGINVGNIGFLTDISPDDLTNSVKDVLNGNFTEDRRFFLEAKINGQVSGKDYLALNEIVKVYKKLQFTQTEKSIIQSKNLIGNLDENHPAKEFTYKSTDMQSKEGIVDLLLNYQEKHYDIDELTNMIENEKLFIKNTIDGSISSISKFVNE